MVPTGGTAAIRGKAGHIGDPQLLGDQGDQRDRDIGGIVEEGAQKADGTQLQGKAQPVFDPTTALVDPVTVGIIQIETAGLLVSRQVIRIAPILAALVGSQKLNGHDLILSLIVKAAGTPPRW
jgi:hypothetical protein